MEFRASCILGKCSTLFCIRKVLWFDHFLNILFIKSKAISTWTWERKNSKTEAGPPCLVSQTLLQLISPFSFLIEPWLVSNVFIALLDSSYHVLERIQVIRSKPWVITHDHIVFLFSEDWDYTSARAAILLRKEENEREESHQGAHSKDLLRRRKSCPSRGFVYMRYMQCRCVQPVGMFCSHIWTKLMETWFSEHRTCCTHMIAWVQIPRTRTECSL